MWFFGKMKKIMQHTVLIRDYKLLNKPSEPVKLSGNKTITVLNKSMFIS